MTAKNAPVPDFMSQLVQSHKDGVTSVPPSNDRYSDEMAEIKTALDAFTKGQSQDARSMMIEIAKNNAQNADILTMIAKFFGGMGKDPYLAKTYHDEATKLRMKNWLAS